MKTVELAVTTIADGTGSVAVNIGSLFPEGALLYAVEWNLGTFDAGVDGTITCTSALNGTALTVATLTNANADLMYYPRAAEIDTAGAALTMYSLPLVRDTVTLTIAQGGNVKTGTAYLHLVEA